MGFSFHFQMTKKVRYVVHESGIDRFYTFKDGRTTQNRSILLVGELIELKAEIEKVEELQRQLPDLPELVESLSHMAISNLIWRFYEQGEITQVGSYRDRIENGVPQIDPDFDTMTC